MKPEAFEYYQKPEKEHADPREDARIREIQALIASRMIVFGDAHIVFNEIFAKEVKTRSRQKWVDKVTNKK